MLLLLLLLFLHSFRNIPFFKFFLLFAMTTTATKATTIAAEAEAEAEATSVVQVNNFCRKSYWVTVMNGTFGVEGNGTWELPSAW